MTLHQMQLFLAVCNYGSLTEAAEAIHISQPSLSVAIKSLEDEFGVSLFTRYRKRLVLTDEGKVFQREAAKIIRNTSHLESYMRDSGKINAKVHLGISAMSSLLYYPKFVIPFCSEYPAVQIEMQELSAIDAVQSISEARLNLAIVRRLAVPEENFEFVPLSNAVIVGCVRKDHRLANKTGVTLDMLDGERLIFTGEKSYATRQIVQGLQQLGLEANVFMYSHQYLLMLQSIEQFNAIGFFFEELVRRDDRFAPFYFEEPLSNALSCTHGLAWKKDALLLNNEMKFLRYCEKRRQVDVG